MMLAAAQLALTFNLICAGTASNLQYSGGAVVSREAAPFASTYRVDLGRRLWCKDDCRSNEPLARVTDDELWLIDYGHPDIGSSSRLYINRESGDLVKRFDMGDAATVVTASCKRSRFTGLARRKF